MFPFFLSVITRMKLLRFLYPTLWVLQQAVLSFQGSELNALFRISMNFSLNPSKDVSGFFIKQPHTFCSIDGASTAKGDYDVGLENIHCMNAL